MTSGDHVGGNVTGRGGRGGRMLATLSARLGVALVALGLAVTAVVAPASADTDPPAGTPATVSAFSLPTWQINGVGWNQVTVGNTVYVVGEFSAARPPGVAVGGPGEIPAQNIFAYDIRTGEPVSGFSHSLNGPGLTIAASPDGSRIYVGGDFNRVDGKWRGHIAAFNTATGALVESFQPNFNSSISAISVSGSTVYAGGAFTQVSGVDRTRLAAMSVTDGTVTDWAPVPDAAVKALLVSPDGTKVVVGGQFLKMNGTNVYGHTAVDPTTGATQAWPANAKIRSYNQGGITSLRTDGEHIYGTTFAFGSGGTFEGPFVLNLDGTIYQLADCLGDTYDSAIVGDVFYSVGHAHNCDAVGSFPDTSPRVRWYRALAMTTEPGGVNVGPDAYGWNYNGIPAPTVLNWWPTLDKGTFTGQAQGPWTVSATDKYVAMAGEFPRVNGAAQQGLARFAVTSVDSRTRPPKFQTTPNRTIRPVTAVVTSGNRVHVSFQSGWDEDSGSVRYQVYRDHGRAGQKLIADFTSPSTFWQLPDLAVDDVDVPAGAHDYRVQISDTSGNTLWATRSASVTVDGTVRPYAGLVLSDQPSSYWRLSDAAPATMVTDYAGGVNGLGGAGVTAGATGAITGDPDTAATFGGTSTGSIYAPTLTAITASQPLTVEAWFKSGSSTGGKIIGFGSARTGNSGSQDRNLYLDNTGKLRFGAWTSSARTIASPQAYNDGAWHHAVATLGEGGATLYVDGVQVARDATITTGAAYSGYWRIGGDTLSGWPSVGSSYLNGTLDEVAVYPRVLTAAQVAEHYATGTTGVANAAPTASFTTASTELKVDVDASASSDPDGSVTGYAWTFGDGATGTGALASHTYATPGTYDVTLTVTDDKGKTGTLVKQVTVAPNQPPVAAFTATITGRTVSVDGSGSSDPDGTIAGYAWNFGDGGTGTGATASHTYTSDGTYTVTLTVTDATALTATTTRQVIASSALAADTFNRTQTGSWGTADTGGDWVTAGTSAVSVGNGAASMALDKGVTGQARLPVSSVNTDVRVGFSTDKSARGASQYFSVIPRGNLRNGYAGRVVTNTGQSMTLSLTRIVNGSETVLASTPLTGVTFTPNTVYNVRVQAVGSGTTNLAMKVWVDGTAEPATWQLTTTDSTAALQAAGQVSIRGYQGSTAINSPVTFSIRNLVAVQPQ